MVSTTHAHCELWVQPRLDAHSLASVGPEIESLGFDGAVFGDSPALVGDVFTTLGAVVATTKSLRLGTGVANPVTRSPHSLAYASAWLQAASGGRFTLGLGRGDSAVALAGHRPATIAEFRDLLAEFQSHWQAASRALIVDRARGSSQVYSRSPLDVVVSGERALAAALDHTTSVSFMVGGGRDALSRMVELAREEAQKRGVGLHELRMSAYVPIGCAPTRDEAIADVRGLVAAFARLGSRSAERHGRDVYDFRHHGDASSIASAQLSEAAIEEFAILASPSELSDRIDDLKAIGVHRLVLLTGSRHGVDWVSRRASIRRLAAALGQV